MVTVLTPSLATSVKDLYVNSQRYLRQLEEWAESMIIEYGVFGDFSLSTYLNQNIHTVTGFVGKYLNLSLNFILTKTWNVTATLLKLVFGLLLSIYFLKDKERLILYLKKIVYAFMDKSKADNFLLFSKEVNSIFSRYIIGRSIDSLIIGSICFIGLMLLGIPFATLVAIIVGITNMIPYFGPFIGAIPSILIVLLVNPVKALWLLIFLIILQQFDGWYLGPKILGNSVGLSPLLVISAIIIGGGTFGVLGMFLGVPLFAVVKLLLTRHIDKKLKAKGTKISEL